MIGRAVVINYTALEISSPSCMFLGHGNVTDSGTSKPMVLLNSLVQPFLWGSVHITLSYGFPFLVSSWLGLLVVLTRGMKEPWGNGLMLTPQ